MKGSGSGSDKGKDTRLALEKSTKRNLGDDDGERPNNKKIARDELTMEEKLALVQEQNAKSMALLDDKKKMKSPSKLSKKSSKTKLGDDDGERQSNKKIARDELTMEEKLALAQEQNAKSVALLDDKKKMKKKKNKSPSTSSKKAATSTNPFSKSSQYEKWLEYEKTYRGLSPEEQGYFVTASLNGRYFNKRNLS